MVEKANIISRLQQDILRMQGFTQPAAGKTMGIGLGELERAFPNGVFPTGTIHEMLCPTPEHTAATSGLMAGIIAALMQHGGACVWISTVCKTFPAALDTFSITPHKVVFITVPRERDILWAMEEALKCDGLAAVVAEVRELTFAQSRRLQLAVESSKVTGFVLRNDLRRLTTTTCVARWQVSHLPSILEDGLPGVGLPRWKVDLLRVRNGSPGSWELQWTNNGFYCEQQETKVHLKEERLQVG